MSSPFVRRSTAITAGAVVFAGLAAAPVAAFAAGPAGIPGIPDASVIVAADPDGAGQLYTLTADVSTVTTITMPDDATLDGAGHTITAVEDAAHPTFPGPVVASAVGTDSAPAELDVKNLNITGDGFGGTDENSGGKLSGIYMFRAGGSLTNVTVDGVYHDSGVQEGNGIYVLNKVVEDSQDGDVNVPRASVVLNNVDVSDFQKTGVKLEGNLSFSVKNSTVGAGAVQDKLTPNGITIYRGASGSVTDSTFSLNSNVNATAALLYNAKNVAFDGVKINGAAAATTGIDVANYSNTIDTTFTMRGGQVTRTAAPAAGTGLVIDGPAGSIAATVTDTPFTGWASATSGSVTTTTTPTAPAVTKVDVTGTYRASRPHARRLRVDMQAFPLGANQAEAGMLTWTIKVDGHRAMTIRQHASDTDAWAQTFRAGTGTHTVQIIKNGVSERTYKIRTR